ncbi:glycosyltransferase [Gloeocapsopsis dulcis]|uniref:Uncharacterized protein n=1 Tax=Gloeocapsopsis dulcis AAB1 = 1H9 TaxID=1433147 RepID=A0A6N8FWP4_9CHRO|nr:glycosyltransferase [Gloeocapsopsis dulcis]MUL36725.1 hypothetical protein [Gloeocapsopsis dulcis AAB1 = 1H9]WNN91299.1 glycosyltransferase [Gloeocapsopsis dulcis]
MEITILAIGSRGDVQPYVALGLGLQAAGHQIQIASYARFADFVRSHGLNFAAVGTNPQQYIQALAKNVDYWQIFCDNLEQLLEDCWSCCQGTEAIIYSQVALPGYHIAEKLQVPCFAAFTNPLTRTRAFPHPLYTTPINFGGTYNWLTYVVHEQLRWQSVRKKINRWRQDLNLPLIPFTGFYSQLQQRQIPILHCFSPTVIPKPKDWSDGAYVTGYWFLKEFQWQPPADLVDFIQSGTPPIYIGFGSMSERNPETVTSLVLDALMQTKQRGILLSNWGGLQNVSLPDNVFPITGNIPHDWLFPLCRAVVHHGGAGTTAAALRAGVPSIVIPFGVDQPFWGQRVADLGVGTLPISQKELTRDQFVAAIQNVICNKNMRVTARALGDRIRAEDGVKRAVEIIQSYLHF